MRNPFRALFDRFSRRVWCVPVESPVELPAVCACCEAPADHGVALERSKRPTLSIPYCSECASHASLGATRVLAAVVSSSLIALTLAACWPLARPFGGVAEVAAVAAVGAVFPLLAILWRRVPELPHRATRRAVRWHSNELACDSAGWAERVAQELCVEVEARRTLAAFDSKWPWMGVLSAVLLGPVFHRLHHPQVRIVNLTETRLTVTVDGHLLAVVEPTSLESPAAGVEVRAPAGRRVLSARGLTEAPVDERTATLSSGHRHLYAPGDHGRCFWLETTGYGRAAADGPDIRPLPPGRRFFSLRTTVDSWFSPNPPVSRDSWSTGGRLTALRQSPCQQAPPEVQRRAAAQGRLPSFATPAQ